MDMAVYIRREYLDMGVNVYSIIIVQTQFDCVDSLCKWAVLHERFGSHLNTIAATPIYRYAALQVCYKRSIRYLLPRPVTEYWD